MPLHETNLERRTRTQVVAHKGERFVYAKTKNATTEEDPKSFISLKIKKKGSGGPSPNFK